jgi:hypothetical protein
MPCDKSVTGAHDVNGDTCICSRCGKTATAIEAETVEFIRENWVDCKRYA